MAKRKQNANDGNEEEVEEGQPQAVPKIVTKNSKGNIRKYHFLKTVKSMKELDNFRFQNNCTFHCGQPLHIHKSIILQCRTKKNRKTKRCNFALMALPPDLLTGDIHVYAFAHHNHLIESEEKRSLHKKEKQLMPDVSINPSRIFRTPDGMEWTFLQTFADYDEMQKFRRKNLCISNYRHVKWWRIRFPCNRRNSSHNCDFLLLAMKTNNQRYHVFKHSEHNHPINNPTRRQPAAGDRQNRPEIKNEDGEDEEEEDEGVQMEEEEEEEHEPIGGEEDEEENEDEEKKDIKFIKDEHQVKVEEEEEEEKEEEEERLEGSKDIKIIEIIENSQARELRLEEKLKKANGKVYKWMSGIEPNEIEGTIVEWDKVSLLKMVEMADQEIRVHPQKLNLWLPWLKCAIPKCLPQIEGFNVRFKDLLKLVFD